MGILTKVTEIEIDETKNPYEKIKQIKGISHRIPRRISQKTAIKQIKYGRNDYYFEKNGKIEYIVIGKNQIGNEYLKSEMDIDEPNSLLAINCNSKENI
ncbi:MAG: DUF3892 domain-containing protein [Candidatus Absconditabacteria bacterium]